MNKNFVREWKDTLDFIMESYSEHLFLLPEEINKDNFSEYGIPVNTFGTCSYIKRTCEKAYVLVHNESIVLDELSERQFNLTNCLSWLYCSVLSVTLTFVPEYIINDKGVIKFNNHYNLVGFD